MGNPQIFHNETLTSNFSGESRFSKFKSLFSLRKEQIAKLDNSAFVILPLYIYPTANAWDSIFSSITANPNLNFSIVINPSDGPGSPPYPDSEYVTGISQLNSYPNVQLYGYVHTTAAARPQTDVMADINVYAGWKEYPEADIHMDGIFFDEAPSLWTPAAYNYMENVTTYTKTTMGSGSNSVIFNPGVVGDPRYYALADTINAFEDYYSAYSATSTTASVPVAYRKQTTAMIHDFTGSAMDLRRVVQDLIVSGGWQGLFISDQDVYSEVSVKWESFCDDMTVPWSGIGFDSDRS